MSGSSTTRISRTGDGYLVRIEGRGTLRQSPAVHAFARHVLESEPGSLVIDLDGCAYLDSTFLGCLIDLHRRHGFKPPVRMMLVAGPEARKRLLAPNCLDGLFNYAPAAPETIGKELELPAVTLDREEMGRHVLECHRRLIEVGGPAQAALEGVVERLAHELSVS
jgi:anti-anti-sigma regulatory factor